MPWTESVPDDTYYAEIGIGNATATSTWAVQIPKDARWASIWIKPGTRALVQQIGASGVNLINGAIANATFMIQMSPFATPVNTATLGGATAVIGGATTPWAGFLIPSRTIVYGASPQVAANPSKWSDNTATPFTNGMWPAITNYGLYNVETYANRWFWIINDRSGVSVVNTVIVRFK